MGRKHNEALTPYARALRRGMTEAERRLWYGFLRDYPVKVYRQRVIGPYIADFYCAGAALVIELDGSQHVEPEGRRADAERTARLEALGLRVLRLPNDQVLANFSGVCQFLDRIIRQCIARPR